MSPLPRPGRKTSVILTFTFVAVLAFAMGLGGALAQETGGEAAADGAVPRVFTVRAEDTNCPEGKVPCWDITMLPVKAGDVVRVTVDLSPSAQPHNFHVVAPIDQKTATETGAVQTLEFTVPTSQKTAIDFVCDVHPTTMVGQILPPEAVAALGAGGHEDIPEMGVHFLAYWVGVIAFAILFIVYGITFFLFKYNETTATTDHWDRSGGEAENKRLGRMAPIISIVIAAVVIAAIVYVARL